jgi:hypothetical protein
VLCCAQALHPHATVTAGDQNLLAKQLARALYTAASNIIREYALAPQQNLAVTASESLNRKALVKVAAASLQLQTLVGSMFAAWLLPCTHR